mmetsp:Transcript_26901/g.65320  ORF Transcript_26901/g.65320 Transcript_26901/m.65320 type:complete len:120 (+) Transcript_26901:308-667(+)
MPAPIPSNSSPPAEADTFLEEGESTGVADERTPIVSQPTLKLLGGMDGAQQVDTSNFTEEEIKEYESDAKCLGCWFFSAYCCCLCTAGLTCVGLFCYTKHFTEKWVQKSAEAQQRGNSG